VTLGEASDVGAPDSDAPAADANVAALAAALDAAGHRPNAPLRGVVYLGALDDATAPPTRASMRASHRRGALAMLRLVHAL
jgi:hypothetical protein